MKVIKISDHVYEKLKELAEKRQLSINQIVDEIINAYLGGNPSDQPIKQIITKIISLQYKTKCRKCNKELGENELAYYVKYTYSDDSSKSYILCLDCYYQSSALAKYYLTKKQYEMIIKGLKAEADRLVDEINKLQTKIEYEKLKQLINETLNKAYEIKYIDSMLVNDKGGAMKLLNEIADLLNHIYEKLVRIEYDVVEYEKKKIKKAIYVKH